MQEALRGYLDDLLAKERSDPPEDKFPVYRWDVCRSYWYEESLQNARAVDSVVLPSALKRDIISDFEQFLHEDTRNWYNRHGIPYKRAYIFYGPPGTGKTSFIQALAGAYGRNVCFLQPNDPRFTDDAFKTCLQKAPDNSIIVLEDIDALFNNRNSMNKSCPLTFTGLLNGLDGIGNAVGQLFVLSTNHLERLDPALIRSGRVDRKFEFGFCSDEALQLMFQRFYPDTTLGDEFVAATRAKADQVTAADLQQAFIHCMNNSDKELIEYMETQFELGARNDEEFAELDRKIKRERKLQELKKQAEEKKEMEALKKEAGLIPEEEEKKEEKKSEEETIAVDSETDSS